MTTSKPRHTSGNKWLCAFFIVVVDLSLTRADSVDQVVVVHAGVEDAELDVVALEHVHTHPARLSPVQRSRGVPLRARAAASRSPVLTMGGQEISPIFRRITRGHQGGGAGEKGAVDRTSQKSAC